MADVATRYNPLSQAATTFPRTIGVPADAAKWEAWFGPMPDKPAPSPFSKYPIEHKTLPDAYFGENVFLAEKISGLVNTTGDFWTNDLLPWQQSQHIGPFTWSEWRFNQVLASRVPHEGVPRLITTSEKTFMARPIRRGLAAEFEGDFVNNPKGQIAMARKIQGMVVSIQTTINLDVQHTILMANERRKSDFQKVGVTRVPIGFEIDMEIESFNAVGKSPSGFVALTAKVKRYLIAKGAQAPLTLLVTPETPMDWALHAQPQPEPFRLVGGDVQRRPSGELGRADLPEGEMRLRDGTRVIEIHDLNIDQDAPPEQLFTRNVLIGEYYLINWEEKSKANLYDGCGAPSGKYAYCSDHRSILIHDASMDKLHKITLRDAIMFGGRETGFPDMSIIVELAKNHHLSMEDFYPTAEGRDGERDSRRNQASNMKRRAHMMLFWQGGNGVRVVRHFGNMDDNVTGDHIFRQIGQTLAAHGIGLSEEENAIAEEVIMFLQELEEAPYNDAFFRALIEKNLRNGAFVGTRLTDEALIEKYGYDAPIQEWRGQEHGGLKLPVHDDIWPIVPPGLASLAGLYSLASTPSYLSSYERANVAIRLIRRLYNKWSEALASEAFRADNRAPWWHPADGMYTFFDNVIYMPRDPLFLSTGGGVTPGAGGAGVSAGGRASLAQFFANIYSDAGSAETRFREFVRLTTTPGAAPVAREAYIPDEFSVLFKMGTVSGPALVEVMSSLTPEMRVQFAEMIKTTRTDNARKIVIGIDRNSEPNREIVDRLMSTETPKKEKGVMLKEFTTLAEGADDRDVIGFDDPQIYRDIARAGTATLLGEDHILHRAPLVMTPGIARTLPDVGNPLVVPSDPASGHTLPLHSGYVEELRDRVQYARFTGMEMRERKPAHTTWGGHHLEYIVAKQNGKIAGATGPASGRSRGGSNLFGAASTAATSGHSVSFGDDELFDERSVVEEIASAVSRSGARQPYEWKPVEPEGRGDRRRPFGYLGVDSALVGYSEYEGGQVPIDETDGHRLIFEFDTDNMRKHIAAAARISDSPVVRWGAIATLLSRCDTPQRWYDMIDADILVPCNALLMRFRQEFLTDSFVMMEPGANTGGTLFNNASSIIGWDVITRRLHLNFVFYSKAMVWNEDNIYVMENAQIQRYIRGRGVKFITNVDQIASDTRRPEEYYDIVSVIVPIEENRFGNERSGIGILGNSQAGQTDRNNALDPTRRFPDYSSAEYVNVWFSDHGDGISLENIVKDSNRTSGRFLESQDALPRLLYQGHQQNYNHSINAQDWSIIIHCKGHLGRNGSYPGVIDVYNRSPSGGFFLEKNPEYPTNVS